MDRCSRLGVGNKGHKVAVIEHQEVPLPAIREGHPGEGNEVVLRFGDHLRGVFVPMKPKRDPGYLAGDLARRRARVSRPFAFEGLW